MDSRPQLAGVPALLALFALVACVYGGRAWQAEFANFDDNLFFGAEAQAFRAADRGDAGALLDPGRPIANAFLPVSHVSLYLDHWLGRGTGHTSRWAHLHSVLLHGLAVFALARLLGRLGARRRVAVAAAAVFAVHPALAESVAWVASRKDVLSGLFSFLCLSAVAEAAAVGRSRAVLAAVLFAVLALYSKGTAVVLGLLAPVVFALCRRTRGAAGIAAVGGVLLAVLLVGWQHAGIAAAQGTMVAGGGRLAQAPGALWHYAATLFWPTGLNVLYPEVDTLARFAAQWWRGALVALAGGALAVWLWRRGDRLAVAGLVMAAAAWLPFNTVWPASSIAAADRYLYLVTPWVALAIIAALRRWGPVVALPVVAGLAAMAFARAGDFRDSEALWTASLRVDPGNAVARINLAVDTLPRDAAAARTLVEEALGDARYPQHRLRAHAFLRDLAWSAGRGEEAGRHARGVIDAAAALPPSPAAAAAMLQAQLTAATILRSSGDLDGARAALAAAQGLAPDDPGVLAYAADALRVDHMAADGSVDADSEASRQAREWLDRAMRIAGEPPPYDVLLARARWQQARGELMSAMAHFRRARELQPGRADAHLGLADLFLATEDYAAAEETARAGIAADVRDPNLLLRLGLAMTGRGRLQDARQYYESYLRNRPRDAAVRRALAAVIAADTTRQLYQLSPDELQTAAARIVELDPDNPKALLLRGLAARLQRRLPAAIVHLEQARERLPDSEDAWKLLAECLRDRGYELLRDGEQRAALDHFRRFVDQAAPGIDTVSALGILRTHWEQIEKRGVEAFSAEDFAAAEAAFRRCLALVPSETSACLQLGLAILQQADDRAEEALALFERAERGQVQAQRDASLPVLWQLHALMRLGRADEARARGERYLAEVRVARPSVLERIRALIEG